MGQLLEARLQDSHCHLETEQADFADKLSKELEDKVLSILAPELASLEARLSSAARSDPLTLSAPADFDVRLLGQAQIYLAPELATLEARLSSANFQDDQVSGKAYELSARFEACEKQLLDRVGAHLLELDKRMQAPHSEQGGIQELDGRLMEVA